MQWHWISLSTLKLVRKINGLDLGTLPERYSRGNRSPLKHAKSHQTPCSVSHKRITLARMPRTTVNVDERSTRGFKIRKAY